VQIVEIVRKLKSQNYSDLVESGISEEGDWNQPVYKTDYQPASEIDWCVSTRVLLYKPVRAHVMLLNEESKCTVNWNN
jgi:hypothetical protein